MNLLDTLKNIRDLQSAAAAARSLPDRAENAVLRITYSSYSSNDDDSLLRAVKAEMIGVRRREAAGEMRRQLRDCANRIEALRVLLPNLAALACIEFGQVARDMHLEASNGETV